MNNFSAGEFLQGFLEEAGEHLARINQNLLRLEQGDALERVELLNELFRSFHTLKGLCGMVNLEPGAQLSHAMENVLRAMQEEKFFPSQAVIDQLLAGTRLLSAVVDSARDPNRPVPDVTREIQAFNRLVQGEQAIPTPEAPSETPRAQAAPKQAAPEQAAPEQAAPGQAASPVLNVLPELAAYPDLVRALNPVDQRKILAAAQAGQSFAVVRFTPSRERAERGENVDRVRERLTEEGAILKATPAVLAGQVSFIFLVASSRILEAGSDFADEIILLTVRVAEQRAAAGQPAAVPQATHTTVRVDLERLDDLIRFTGSLTLLRGRLNDSIRKLDGASPALRRELREINQQMARTLRDLRRATLRARMVPLAEAFNHMPLVVRDLARASQKDVRLVIHGETTEVDKALVERLLDPLIHLVRNAITHGIEPPAERAAQGKPAHGTLTLQGFPEGDHIRIEVADDGRGIDLARVAEKAAALGWIEPGVQLDAAEALDIITRPGFSTQAEASLAAGRGVGLDVVQRMVRSFGGWMEVDTTPGRGTTFRLHMPLTLVMMDTLFVTAGGRQYAVPQDAIERIIEVDPSQIVRAESGELLPARDSYFVVHRLEAFGGRSVLEPANPHGSPVRAFGLVGLRARSGAASRPEAPAGPVPTDENGAPTVSGTNGGVRQLLLVDTVQDLREVVVHTLADPLVSRPGIGGATEMPDGRVVLILDLPGLFHTLQKGGTRRGPASNSQER